MSQRPSHRSLYASFWDDEEQQALSPIAYRVLTTLKGTLPAVGIGTVYDAVLAKRCACTLAQLRKAYAELDRPKHGGALGWIVREQNIVWVVNGLRYEPSLCSGNAKHKSFVSTLLAQFGGVTSPLPIVRAFRAHYAEWFPEDRGKAIPIAIPDSPEDSHDDSLPGMAITDGYGDSLPDSHTSITVPVPVPVPEPTKTAAAFSASEPTYITRCVVALNRGMRENPSVSAFMEVAASTQTSAVLWAEDGIDIATAEEVIGRLCKAFRPTNTRRRISGLKYFDAAVRERWAQLVAVGATDPTAWAKGARSATESEWLQRQGY